MAKVIFLALIVTFIFAAGAVRDDSCPAENELAPCTCDGEGVNCMGNLSLDKIRKAFSANFKYGGVRSIWIQKTPITTTPADLIGQLKVKEVYIEINNITTTDLKFLDGAKKTLAILSLFGNKISQLNFTTFGTFSSLFTLNLGRNLLTSIPANGFKGLKLGTLILSQNKITAIGPNAFDQIPNLQRLEMDQNQLTILGPNSFAITSQQTMINLVLNQISEVSSSAFSGSPPVFLRLSVNQLKSLKFDPFGALVTKMGNRGGAIEVSANPFTCSGCDYTWIVQNKNVLSRLLLGFKCQDGTTLPQLTKAKIGC